MSGRNGEHEHLDLEGLLAALVARVSVLEHRLDTLERGTTSRKGDEDGTA